MDQSPIPTTGFVRLPAIIGTPPGTGPIPISRATWYTWVQQGKAPKPIKLGPRVSAWRAEDIQAFINRLAMEAVE